MPSHIFVRLGLWDEAISSNIASVNSAKCYAEKASLTGNFDEELHGLDYLMYAYLQKGDNQQALQQLNYIKQDIKSVSAQNLKVAYAYAAIPSRYVLENRMWSDAAELTMFPDYMPWDKFPWQKGIVTFTRLMGKVNTGDIKGAKQELDQLDMLHNQLVQLKDIYKAKQLEVQLQSGMAWIEFKKGNKEKALEWMQKAADLEDATEKHPVTPGEVLPARELLGDMLMQMNEPENALVAYEADLKRHANRFNALYGAASAAEKSGKKDLAKQYYNKLIEIAASGSERPELQVARRYTNMQHSVAGID
jgi:tetratricopeptide (TPR) repeat protein